jgi:hypothetical protein
VRFAPGSRLERIDGSAFFLTNVSCPFVAACIAASRSREKRAVT